MKPGVEKGTHFTPQAPVSPVGVGSYKTRLSAGTCSHLEVGANLETNTETNTQANREFIARDQVL